MNRYIFFIIGNLTLILGVIGIILPVVPTTPLLMASCYFYGKSSPRFNEWLIGTAIYQKYAREFIESRTLSLKRKIFLLTFASTMLLIPLVILDGWLKLFIIVTYLYLYYYFIFQIKTK